MLYTYMNMHARNKILNYPKTSITTNVSIGEHKVIKIFTTIFETLFGHITHNNRYMVGRLYRHV